jgi:lysophospholipase L1-like esterase
MKKPLIILSLVVICTFSFSQEKNVKPGSEQNLQKSEQKTKAKMTEDERFHNDWANLEKYKSDNEKIGLPAKGEKRIVFMGNSITEGWSRICPEFFKDKPYVNRGISGQTTPQMLIRLRPDVINLKPSVVILNAGVNDIAGNTGPSTLEMIEDNISSMAELARSSGIKVIIASVLPAFDFPWKPGLKPAEKIASLNEWLKDYSLKNKFVYLDYYSSMVDSRKGLNPLYSEDGVHPNEAGYKVMGPLAEKAISLALQSHPN